MDEIQYRKVGINDFHDVIAIRKGVSDDFGHLPALYQTTMKNHIGYAAFHKEKMVAFACITFVDEDETMVPRGLRVHKEYEGRGLVIGLSDFIDRDIKGNKNLKRTAYVTGHRGFFKKIDDGKARLLFQKVAYTFFWGSMDNVSKHLREDQELQIKVLQASELKAIFQSKVLSKRLFPHGRSIAGLIPYRMLYSNVDHFINEFCHLVWSDYKEGMSGIQNLMTVGVSYPSEESVRYCIDIYGELSEEPLLHHITEHLRRSAAFKCDKINVLVFYENENYDVNMIKRVMEQISLFVSDKNMDVLFCVEEKIVPCTTSKY